MVRSLPVAALLVSFLLSAAPSYVATIEAWRKDREEKLKAPDGWLTVAGLFWLKEGENRVGGDPSFEIALPQERAPQRAGTVEFRKGKAIFPGRHRAFRYC